MLNTMRGVLGRWTYRPNAPPNGDAQDLLSRVLHSRGLRPDTDTLHPKLTALHDPSRLPGMDRAAERLLAAIDAHEPIAVFGDYDVDGVTASATLVRTLRAIDPDARVITYIPHRTREGYGLNTEALRHLADRGARVAVSVDCGVTARDEARFARDAGLDLIITDHHALPGSDDDLPDAFALIHPEAPGSAYPFAGLCGAGVAYKLAWRLLSMRAGSARLPQHWRELLIDLLALTALGTIADVVPLTDENRAIARFGLARAGAAPFVGLRALKRVSDLDNKRISEMDVGFRLGPRLNAAGRLGHARDSLELLTTDDEDRADEIARAISKLNEERRGVERDIVEQAATMAEQAGMTGDDRRAIVLAQPGWHTGVIGIVCSKLVERFHRPVLLADDQGQLAKGSGRSVEGFDLHGAMTRCADLFDKFGGHEMAGGFTLPTARVADLAERMTEIANDAITPDQLCKRVTIDCDARPEELHLRSVTDLSALAPFGAGNPRVRVRLTGVRLTDHPKPMGAHGKHLSLIIGPSARPIRAVGWNMGEHRNALALGSVIDAVVEPKISTFTGRPKVELELADFAVGAAVNGSA